MSETSRASRASSRLPFWAGIASGLWLLAATAFMAFPCVDGPCEQLRPGEFGDFVAGIAAPLAFLWFLVAVRAQYQQLAMQATELSLQREELHLLREEMHTLSEHQGSAARARELERQERLWAAQPRLVQLEPEPPLMDGQVMLNCARLSNEGPAVTQVELRSSRGVVLEFIGPPGELRSQTEVLRVKWRSGLPEGIDCKVTYTLPSGSRWWQRLQLLEDRWVSTETRRE